MYKRGHVCTDRQKTDRNKEVVKSLDAGMTQAQVAKKFSINPSRVSQIWTRHKFKQQLRAEGALK